jgi:hypothetical protein
MCDPEKPATRAFGVTLEVSNVSTDRLRVNHGDAIRIAAKIVNRSVSDCALTVNLSVGDRMLADETPLSVPGRPIGDVPGTAELVYPHIQVFTTEPETVFSRPFVVLEPGVHRVLIDVMDETGQNVAHASQVVFVEVDPKDGGADKPFEVKAREDLPYPIWELVPPVAAEALWTLLYAPRHPTFEAARSEGRAALSRFWSETFCSALVEWALRLERDGGNGAGFQLLSQGEANNNPLWERYDNGLQRLINGYEDPLQCLALQREVVSLMLCLLEMT